MVKSGDNSLPRLFQFYQSGDNPLSQLRLACALSMTMHGRRASVLIDYDRYQYNIFDQRIHLADAATGAEYIYPSGTSGLTFIIVDDMCHSIVFVRTFDFFPLIWYYLHFPLSLLCLVLFGEDILHKGLISIARLSGKQH